MSVIFGGNGPSPEATAKASENNAPKPAATKAGSAAKKSTGRTAKK